MNPESGHQSYGDVAMTGSGVGEELLFLGELAVSLCQVFLGAVYGAC